ncbi:MAG: hypothetical protein D6709_06370 [Chloroflexi bacterium]|jgi:hypothetical protein|uniref:Arylsulfatase n=1 Tax=Candidatus Thermofonsia Clade 3 bacterium TaxID=2364212 RepID=A0A2M8QFZ7_9CHLR|nr:hypothetical protein [Candidatus Roseilinea sp. NK_OTU-006]PJF48672.1 MAG: hypothetical protein CUN48_02125 [Candidatus Thermofonsia Clade 3 bacterium]RMG64103.1 MAG: hypothetical protein D6709_06370 [Chloroflexota bacterium]
MLTLFHTAASNVALFDALLKQLAPDIPARHVVDEAILREVRAAGAVTPAVIARVRAALAPLTGPQSFVLCTCSSIGGLAEQSGARVMRVDRPMAERAVSLGRRIAIAATLQSTLAPTQALIQDVARQADKAVETGALFISSAWPLIERGDPAGYAREIAAALADACAGDRFDVIVLAQASMAVAEPLCADLPCPVLSSPRLGVEAAARAYRARFSDPLSSEAPSNRVES